MCLRNSPGPAPTETSETGWPAGKLTCLALGAALLVGGCAASTVDRPRLAAVRKVAVVGFSAHLDLGETDLEGNPLPTTAPVGPTAALEALREGAGRTERAARADTLYDGLRHALAEALGWSVLTRGELLARPAYAAVLQEQQSPAGRGLLAKSGHYLHPEGIIWEIKARALSEEDRMRLLDGLGVDLLLVAQVQLTRDPGDDPSGARPVAQVELLAFARGSVDPVWHYQGPAGPPAETPEAAADEAYRAAAVGIE